MTNENECCPMTDMVKGVIDEIRPMLEAHGGDIELVSVEVILKPKGKV